MKCVVLSLFLLLVAGGVLLQPANCQTGNITIIGNELPFINGIPQDVTCIFNGPNSVSTIRWVLVLGNIMATIVQASGVNELVMNVNPELSNNGSQFKCEVVDSLSRRYDETITIIVKVVCQPSCVNGVCNETTGQCDCTPGYTGVACDERVCQPSCVNGVCNGTTGQCDCSPGYTGISCDERVCQPSCVNGVCNGTSGHCVCSPGYTGVSCDEILPLVVRFINDSPRVLGDSVEADILISRPVQSLVCRLKAGSFITEQDCSSGHVVFSGLSPAVYTLRVVARDSHNIKAFVKNRFEVTEDPDRCTLHLINEGVSVRGDSVRVEFTGRGPASDYLCHLDKTQPYQCSSPVEVSGLSPGKHVMKVVPTGCGRNRMNLKTAIIIE